MIEIQLIDASQTYKLRKTILRPKQSIEDCKYSSDYEKNSFHLGAFLHNELISIASFSHESHPSLQGDHHYRLRGMATVPAFQKQCVGSSLIHSAEEILQKCQAQILWCNARITVTDYYSRLGFQGYGEIFDLPPIGPHKVMYKSL
ncbi:GNAT family N-acetyltransferase [Bacillus sp. DX4.1]|uniref:GNAT family N-acetyltransferase n=1 Tax=Bacillus sp. DX4.1 TaxID=3055867 RepID=UPI00259FF149|nr:GNAT family N-acetyltransferase [Bacillus sp. DX4.1]MDM5187154.1 GNAT family N-acetyltransferase [Bacillus sp. DX4.1]